MNYTEIKDKLECLGQEQVLRFYDELDEISKKNLLDEISKVDFDIINKKQVQDEEGEVVPLSAVTVDEIEKNKDEYEELGLQAIREGKVALVLLAGGQGTRLGADVPKGAYNIGITKELFIFQCQINNLMDVVNKAGCMIPLAIMTSDKNDQQTKTFFEEHDFFGYDRNYVDFFVQEMVPATDFDGKLLLERKDHLALSPNGNGGWFNSMIGCGLAEKYKNAGVEWVNVYSVDNVLQRMGDPVFVGATIKSGCAIGSKVISKAAPDEKVGVMCLRDGRPSIVEYYELTEEMANLKDANGRLAYNWGVILNYLFKFEELIKIGGAKMPLHIVKKKVPYIDENGQLVKPAEPNGLKYETLILDMISMMDGCLPFEIIREKEFAPVKNLTGVDSVDTARALLQANGVEL